MNSLINIRKCYQPLQPAVNQSAENVRYNEFLPDLQLQNFIYCYWQLKTVQQLKDTFHYRVIADGCIDIFFELNNPDQNFVMGFCKKYTEFPLKTTFNYIGIRFLPTMFPQLFKINAAELSNRALELHLVLPQVSVFLKNNFMENLNQEQIKQNLDNYFLNLIRNIPFDYDVRLYKAVDIILKNAGVIDIQKGLDTGISPRQLQRLFEYYIGDTAKTFSKVIRFQNILKAKPSRDSLKKNKLFFDSGYYDQAHFIKEFKTLYGVTPAKAFGR